MEGSRFAFGPFVLDPGAGTLLRHETPVLVGHRGLMLLSAFAGRPGEILRRSELIDAAWPGVVVEDGNLTVQIALLRKLLGPAADGGEWIVTVPRVGYRFNGTVEALSGAHRKPLPIPDKPSIAVLPFANLGHDPEQEAFADGLAEDLITDLSRFRNLSVAARHASSRLVGKGALPAAHELGVDFIVKGSVRKSGERVRITVHLIDADTSDHVWAERFDREASDIFAVQDHVVSAIVATLGGRMVNATVAHLRKKPTSSWTAQDFFLQGREIASLINDREAAPFFARAISIDPNFAHAYASLAISHLGSYWFNTDSSTLDEACLAAQKALELDSNDPNVQQANGMVALWMRKHEQSTMHFDRAIELNPVDAEIRADRANAIRFAGQPEDALAAIDEALQRSKFPPYWFWWIRGGILIDLERYQDAVAALNNIPRKEWFAWLQLAAAHAQLDHAPDAALALARGRELKPNVSLRDVIAISPYAHREAIDPLLNGLRKAGLSD